MSMTMNYHGSQLDNIQWTWITVGESTMDMNHSWRIDKGHRSWLENEDHSWSTNNEFGSQLGDQQC